MGPFAADLLLESLLAPFALACMVLAAVRWIRYRPLVLIAPAVAMLLAVGATYGLVLGWPSVLAPSARDKVLLALVIGLVAGIFISKRPQWTRPVLITGAFAIPIWVGLPALQQGRLDGGLLILPIAFAAISLWLIEHRPAPSSTADLLLASALAAGLAGIAAFARSLTFTELGLSLAAALIAILIVGRRPVTMPATLASAAMLLAMATSLLLYSEASLAAILVLGATIGAERLARLSTGDLTVRHLLLFLALPTVIAIVIARIDAGPISIY